MRHGLLTGVPDVVDVATWPRLRDNTTKVRKYIRKIVGYYNFYGVFLIPQYELATVYFISRADKYSSTNN